MLARGLVAFTLLLVLTGSASAAKEPYRVDLESFAFSTGTKAGTAESNGALMLANKPDTIEEPVYYKQILTYGVIVTLVGPLLVWAALVLPGW